MPHFKTVGGMLLAAALAGCTDRTPPPVAPVPAVPSPVAADESLMRAVFGGQYQPTSKTAEARLKPSGLAFRAEAVQHAVLASGEALLLARARLVDQDENANGGLNGWLALYILRSEQGAWRVARRHDNLMYLGRDAALAASMVKLGKNREGLALVTTNRWEGCAFQDLTLFDLGTVDMKPLTEAVSVGSSATVDECNRAYSDSRWSVHGKWRIAPGTGNGPLDQLVIDFTGDLATPPHDEHGQPTGPRVPAKVSGSARYAYDAARRQYQLVEGANLVPQDPADYDG